ncbi:hypothetical protein ACD661_11460 [Legionella lytica]|uniref:Acid-soluble spore protein P n=1 Tax=Legionella lytica TaxID=96232 RepID=A0ABW8DC84_9GAMM
MNNHTKNDGKGHNLNQEDRIKGGEHSHKGTPKKQTNLSQDDKRKTEKPHK